MVVQSPSSSSSSYEDDDDNNQESDEEVEKKTPNSKQDSDDDDDDDDSDDEQQDSEKNRYKVSANVSDNVNLNKRKSRKSVTNKSIIVALNADKRSKTITTGSGSVSGSNNKLNPFGKKWSKEDELVLLQGMVNFKKTNNGGLIDSKPKYDKLVESIKDSLSFAYTNKQLQNKVRSLGDKYEIVAHKVMSGNGENLFENKPHEEQLYNLSKIYWEDVKIIQQKSSSRKKIKKSNENSELPYYYLEQLCTVSNSSLNSLMKANAEKGWEDSIGKANAVKLNQKAKDLMIAEVEIHLKRCQLIKDTTKLLLGGLKE
ncbi:hypothetical protein AQUCO_01200175v1 [Aquilegia coerulea]|uniref:Glabrous enhancer-binding protein-like DBD domain-containing protein n=1 Tax=Aquilegia coerulea TaxID=218851 RepID=A0A2G5E4S6_AQUCA|nr:hypothetical protein AQUCO_01200175v1 [Aquilegia coerulea]